MQMMICGQKNWPVYVGTPKKGQTFARGQGARHDGARDRGEYFGFWWDDFWPSYGQKKARGTMPHGSDSDIFYGSLFFFGGKGR